MNESVIFYIHTLKNAEKCRINTVLTSVNRFAFRTEILYICITEVEIALNIKVISTFFVHKVTYQDLKISISVFTRLLIGATM